MRLDPMSASRPQHPASDDSSAFAEKSRRFNDADAAFRTLLDSLTDYRAAVLHLADSGLAVAANIDKFFDPTDKPHRLVATKFRDAQLSIREKWLHDSQKSFDADVLAPIKSRVDDIPLVRTHMKERATALAEMQRRQKKLQSERKRDGPRLRDKQRRLKDISDRYAMLHDDVIKRFNYIDRNMGTFVTAPLRSLIGLMADMSASTVTTLEEVSQLVARAPPITNELSPMPLMSALEGTGGVVDSENWNDDFDDDISPENDDVPGVNGAVHADDDDDRDTVDFETDSASARASGKRPPRGRVRSADASSNKTPGASNSGLDNGLSGELPTSPRRGRQTTSAPADSTSIFPPILPLPLANSNGSVTGQREPALGPSSSSGRASNLGEAYYVPSVGTSAASSTSTENIAIMDRAPTGRHIDMGYQLRRNREGKGSGDTVGSAEGLIHNEVLMRLMAVYDFTPLETNELELHVGDIIEVSSKNDSGWWCGQCRKSKGYFPRNYTRELTKTEELEFLAEKRRRKRRGHRRENSHDMTRL